MTKAEIRSEYLNLRVNLSKEKYASLNQSLTDNFFVSLDLSDVKTLHTFLPILSKNEPDAWLIIDKLKRYFPQARISVPKVESDHLINFYYVDENQLKKNQWGILEPTSGERTPTENIDLVIVPLLAFDKKGNRVGYGKGFYDRFLNECRLDCKKIGLSFFEPIDEILDIDSHDIKLTNCVTPLNFYSF